MCPSISRTSLHLSPAFCNLKFLMIRCPAVPKAKKNKNKFPNFRKYFGLRKIRRDILAFFVFHCLILCVREFLQNLIIFFPFCEQIFFSSLTYDDTIEAHKFEDSYPSRCLWKIKIVRRFPFYFTIGCMFERVYFSLRRTLISKNKITMI